MTTLTANLKHYYQCLYAWPVWGMFLFLIFTSHDTESQIIWCVMFSGGIGILASQMIREVAQKPFAFILPGHKRAVARTTSVMGVLAAILCSLAMLRSSASATEPFSILLGGVGAGLTCFWLAVFASFCGTWVVAGLILLAIVGSGIASEEMQITETSIAGYAGLVAVISAGVSVAAYRILSRWDLCRRYCMRLDVGTFTGFISLERARRIAAMRRHDFGDFAFDRFFMSRIGKAAPYSRMRHEWAAIYRSLRPMLAFLRRPICLAGTVVSLAFLVFLCGFLQDNGSAMFLVVGSLSCLGAPPAIQTCFPASPGRRERFHSLVLVSMVWAGLATMTGIVCGLFSNMVAHLMPDFFVPANMQMLFLPVFVAPLVLSLREVFARCMHLFLMPLLTTTVDCAMVGLIRGLVSAPQYFGTAWAMTVGVWAIYVFGLFCATGRFDLVARRA